LQELVLYFLRECITNKNYHIKHLIITNVNEWFVFNAVEFEKHFVNYTELVKNFTAFEDGSMLFTNTSSFYETIAKLKIDQISSALECTYFDIRLFTKEFECNDEAALNKLMQLYKILSPEHLLKLPFENDSNILNQNFYSELLYIMGLTEIKDSGKKIYSPLPGKRTVGRLTYRKCNPRIICLRFKRQI